MLRTPLAYSEETRVFGSCGVKDSTNTPCLEHKLLIKKLETFGIVGTAKKWFQSYL